MAGVAQSISVSPGSIMGPSQTPGAAEISVYYKSFGISATSTSHEIFKGKLYKRQTTYVAAFVQKSIKTKWVTIRGRLYYYNKPFLSPYASRVNFGGMLVKEITSNVSIYIKHISNAGIGQTNPGVDNIGIEVSL